MNRSFEELSDADLKQFELSLEQNYRDYVARNLKLNMARGKPGPDVLDASMPALETLKECNAADGTDCRNYGIVDGLPEMRGFFGEVLGIDPERIIIGGNASLNLMYDSIMRLVMFGPAGHPAWRTLPRIKWLCPAPGYDRHFAVTGEFGFEMIPVPMTGSGPDMDMVEQLVAADPSIKGIWCVPLYSNPQGICYSDETVRRLGAMKCAAPDFRIFWDNAYGVHHLFGETKLADIFASCEDGGNPERPYYFFSTSKITFPGAGVSMMATGYEERKMVLSHMKIQTIGHDKLNQLRTLHYLKDKATLKAHMEKLASLLRPRFEIVLNTLDRELGGTGLASWTSPGGGYFVALDTLDNCARETLRLAAEAGVTMTGAGATFPEKKDPRDRNIRIAPSYPKCDELRTAMELFCVCVKLAGVRKILAGRAKR